MRKGERIRELRVAAGMTQAELAAEVGVTDAAMRGYESGRRAPKPAHLYALAEALGVAPQSLVDHGAEDPDVFAHAMLELESAGLGPVPEASGGGASVRLEGCPHAAFVAEWADMRGRLQRGEVGEAEYRSWADSWSSSSGDV